MGGCLRVVTRWLRGQEGGWKPIGHRAWGIGLVKIIMISRFRFNLFCQFVILIQSNSTLRDRSLRFPRFKSLFFKLFILMSVSLQIFKYQLIKNAFLIS